MGAPVVWFEISGRDLPAMERFYGELLGWKVDAGNPMHYGMVDTGAEGGIPGGIYAPDQHGGAYVSIYAQVDDLDAALAEAVRLGGEVAQTPITLGSGARTAMIRDPEWHVVGLIQQPRSEVAP
jgi:predicted enzyme related to lactoylglutathione lyase